MPGWMSSVYIMMPKFYFLFRDTQLQKLVITCCAVLAAGEQDDNQVIFFQGQELLQIYLLKMCSARYAWLNAFPHAINRHVLCSKHYRSQY